MNAGIIFLYSPTVDGDGTVNQVVFMKTRAYSKGAASLIASGPRGCIHFGNVFQDGHLLAKFKGVSAVTFISLNLMESILVLLSYLRATNHVGLDLRSSVSF
jgi:hypothetical protein